MNIQQPKVDLKNNFELYLEGIKVDFNSITISETEGGIPAASVLFTASPSIMRILPGTIMQVFGYVHEEGNSFLLYEGEVTGINFQSTGTQRSITLKSISLLGGMIKAKFRPSDAIMTQESKDNSGIQAKEVNIVIEGGEDSSISSTTIDEFKEIENKDDQKLKGKVGAIGISAVFGLTDEFSKLLADDQPGGKGDFIPMLQQFNAYFEYNDLFFGLRSFSYKFGRSIFASPNPDLLNKIKTDLFLESLNKIKSSGISDIFGADPYTLMQVLVEFQRYLHYNFIAPAAYTACKPFYLNVEPTNVEPLRMIYIPKFESAPPALCNIFFPEQVSSCTYSRDMMDEPTRIIGKATIPFLDKNKTRNIDYSQSIVYPEVDLGEEKAYGNFTTEESYRGINFKVFSYSNLQGEKIITLNTKKENGTQTSAGEEPDENEIKGLIKPYAYNDYMNLKYRTRVVAITGEWNPYRMVGLAGLVLDESGISIFGTVNAIETNISSNGTATSRVTLRHARIVYDGEFERVDFSQIPGDSTEGYSKYLIHDLTNDGVMAVNKSLYYQDLYSFENIGQDVYTYIIQGKLSHNDGFYKVQQEKDIFDYTQTFLDPKTTRLDYDTKFDNSILYYLRDKEGKISIDIPKEYNVKIELRNTYLLYKAVQKLRSVYTSKKYKRVEGKKIFDMKQAYVYMAGINKRNLITKEAYFDFIGAKPENKSQLSDAHDAKAIFKEGIEELRSNVILNTEKQYSVILNTETAELSYGKTKAEIAEQYWRDAPMFDIYMRSGGDGVEKDLFTNQKFWNADDLRKQKELVINEIVRRKDIYLRVKKELEKVKVEHDAPVPTITEEKNYYEELLKPYNITRRMHVILAFKKYNNTSTYEKLKVVK